MKEIQTRPVMVVLSFAVLPFQKRHLRDLMLVTGKTRSELAREALSLLFGQYSKMMRTKK